MAQKQLDLLESTDPVSAQLNYSHPTIVRDSVINEPILSETQNVTGLLMGMYDDEKPASKEDISLLMATLDGILNNLISITNELSETRQNITKDLQTLSKEVSEILIETRNRTAEKTTTPPTRKTNPCYICRELGHWAPECPQKQDPAKKGKDKDPQKQDPPKKSKDKDPCYICQNLGHWASECTDKENNPPGGNKKKNSTPKKPSLKRENAIPKDSEPPKKKAKLALPKKK